MRHPKTAFLARQPPPLPRLRGRTRCSPNFSFPQHFELTAQFRSVSRIINQQAANYVAITHVLLVFQTENEINWSLVNKSQLSGRKASTRALQSQGSQERTKNGPVPARPPVSRWSLVRWVLYRSRAGKRLPPASHPRCHWFCSSGAVNPNLSGFSPTKQPCTIRESLRLEKTSKSIKSSRQPPHHHAC